ncbi:MAG: acyl carrier protein [Candidatus Marinamargulisbacteria bacterium]|jgi:acyl carrier protein
MDYLILIKSIAEQELNRPLSVSDLKRHFSELGITSIVALKISLQIEEKIQKKLPITFLWTFPTFEKIAGYLSVPENMAALAPSENPTAENEGDFDTDEMDVLREALNP